MLIRVNSNNRPRLHLKRCCALVLYTSNTNLAVEIPFGIFTAPSNRFPAILIPDPILDDVCKVRLLHPDAGDLFEGASCVFVVTRQLQHELLVLVGVGDGEVSAVKQERTCGRGAGCASFRFETQTTVLQFRTGPRSHAQCLG